MRTIKVQINRTAWLTILLFATWKVRLLRLLYAKTRITKTYLYIFDPLKPHFYTVKLGLPGYILFFYYFSFILFFLFFLKNIDCGYSLEPLRQVPTIYVLSINMKNIRIFIWKLSVFCGVTFNKFESRYVLIMVGFETEQASFCLTWSIGTPEDRFSSDEAQIVKQVVSRSIFYFCSKS